MLHKILELPTGTVGYPTKTAISAQAILYIKEYTESYYKKNPVLRTEIVLAMEDDNDTGILIVNKSYEDVLKMWSEALRD